MSGVNKDDEGEHMGRVKKRWKSNYNGENRQHNVNLNRHLSNLDLCASNCASHKIKSRGKTISF